MSDAMAADEQPTWEERMSARHGGAKADNRRSVFGFPERPPRQPTPEPPEGPGDCRECYTWDPDEGIYKTTCMSAAGPEAMVCRYGHAHHDGEIWLA